MHFAPIASRGGNDHHHQSQQTRKPFALHDTLPHDPASPSRYGRTPCQLSSSYAARHILCSLSSCSSAFVAEFVDDRIR